MDKRTDIWSFGCVLYEMLTGRRAFGGQTIIETLWAVAKAEPEWDLIAASHTQHGSPGAESLPQEGAFPTSPPHRRRAHPHRARGDSLRNIHNQTRAAWADPRGCDRARGVDHVVLPGPPQRCGTGAGRPPLTHTAIDLTANAQLALGIQVPLTGFDSPVVALSRDGRYLAYVGQSPSGTMLYLREIGALTVRPVTGTEGAIYAFFSPDTRWLGFLTNDKVKKVPLHSGAPSILCDARQPIRASWTLDDTIYFIDVYGGRISSCRGRRRRPNSGGGGAHRNTGRGERQFQPGLAER